MTVWIFFCELCWFVLWGSFNLPLEPLHAAPFPSPSPMPTPLYQTYSCPAPQTFQVGLGQPEQSCILGRLIWPPCRVPAGGSELAGSLLQYLSIWMWNEQGMEREWKGNERHSPLALVLGCQGTHLRSLKTWFKGLRGKKGTEMEAGAV